MLHPSTILVRLLNSTLQSLYNPLTIQIEFNHSPPITKKLASTPMHRSFRSRALVFFAELKANRFPNAVSLAQATQCARNTAMRCIERLRDEYGVPLAYDQSERGYYLTNKNFELDGLLPGKDEFTALLLLRELASMIDSQDIKDSIESLWQQCNAKDGQLGRDLESLLKVFSSDLTQVGVLADTELFPLVNAAHRGDSVSIQYRSPWRHTDEQTYRGRVMRVHYSDGSLYVFLHEASGRGLVLNGSFIKKLEILNETVPLVPLPTGSPLGSSLWLEGFGVWASEELPTVRIEILPPASEYYRVQKWQDDQEDEMDPDGVLIRRFSSMLSPELVRRILSIGRFIKRVQPQKLSELVLEQAGELCTNLKS